jgi:beta-ureidopropionase
VVAAIKVALGQFASTDDVDENLARLEAQIAEAAAAGAKLIAFHELSTTTYFCFEDRNASRFDLAETIPGPSTERIEKAAAANDMHVVFPLYEKVGDVRYNTAALIDPAEGLQMIYRKSHVPTSRARQGQRGADEAWYFSPGDTGFNVWETSLGLNVGIVICYDRHFPEGPRTLGIKGAHIVFVPTASYRKFVIETMWEPGLQSTAWSNTMFVAGINKVGPLTGPGVEGQYPGRSVFFDPEGIRLAVADDQEGILYADVDPSYVEDSRTALNFYHYRRPDLYGTIAEPVQV